MSLSEPGCRSLLARAVVVSLGEDRRIPSLVKRLTDSGVRAVSRRRPFPAGEADVLIVLAPVLDQESTVPHVDELLALHPEPPVLLMTDLRSAARFLAPRVVRHLHGIHEFGEVPLARAVAAAALDPAMSRFEGALLEAVGNDAHVLAAAAIRRLGVPASLSGHPPPKTQMELAKRLGCNSEHLSRVCSRAGLRLGTAMRWSRLLHALLLRNSTREGWSVVGAHLGWETSSGFTHFVRALTGMPPIKAERLPVEEWLERALGEAIA
jgi:AraC-like DNA-binding protein